MPRFMGSTLIALVITGVLRMAAAHELPDGQAERAIQIVVSHDSIELEYRFGMSPRTMAEVVELRQQKPAAEITELEGQFLEVLSPVIPSNIKVAANGRVLTLEAITSKLIYQHHLQCACVLTYRWAPGAKLTKLAVEDRNFREWPGYYRAAVKARGDELAIEEANVPPVLVRAERIAVPLTSDQSNPLITIEATLAATVSEVAPLPEQGSVAEPGALEPPTPRDNVPRDNVPRGNVSRGLSLRLMTIAVVAIVFLALPLILLRKRSGSQGN